MTFSPPPPLPLHILRSDFYPETSRSLPSNIAREDFSPLLSHPIQVRRQSPPPHRISPQCPPTPYRKIHIPNHIYSSPPKSPTSDTFNTADPPRTKSPMSSSDSSEDDQEEGEIEVEVEVEDPDELIPKPQGEAGRPGRGGYNLEHALNWEHQEYKKLKELVHQLAEKHLNVSRSFTNQSMKSIQDIRKHATQRFPILSRYLSCWPVTDLLKLHLKYANTRERRVAAKTQLRNIQKTMEESPKPGRVRVDKKTKRGK